MTTLQMQSRNNTQAIFTEETSKWDSNSVTYLGKHIVIVVSKILIFYLMSTIHYK